MTEKANENGEKGRNKAWKAGLDLIVLLGGAVLIALVVKSYAFDVYLIPSGSMETALHGRPDGGDRIFCSKLNFLTRLPRRWEVSVFEFPYENARRIETDDTRGTADLYKGQNFVKRVVGLPGETLAIARGDIWVRKVGGSPEFRREVKPDSVQRGMWLNVYDEDFSDITLNELAFHWSFSPDAFAMKSGGVLAAEPRGKAAIMKYRPRLRAGGDGASMAELPGIPDRYVLRQPVQFRCANIVALGKACGHVFTKTVWAQNVQGRCPECGSMQPETSVFYYHRRSGLASRGQYNVSPKSVPQGERTRPREAGYHIVPDLRVTTRFRMAGKEAALGILLTEDSRGVEARLNGDGRLELSVNGAPVPSDRKSVARITPGAWHEAEFYVVDGMARLFVDGGATPVIEAVVWNDARPSPESLPRASGVTLSVTGGAIEFERLGIDRDIFYYSGREKGGGVESVESMDMMDAQGQVFINTDSFLPMGDHTVSSYDARTWGPTPTSLLRGPAMFVWWPPDRVGRIPSPE